MKSIVKINPFAQIIKIMLQILHWDFIIQNKMQTYPFKFESYIEKYFLILYYLFIT